VTGMITQQRSTSNTIDAAILNETNNQLVSAGNAHPDQQGGHLESICGRGPFQVLNIGSEHCERSPEAILFLPICRSYCIHKRKNELAAL
jgi:hypothetical protein